MKNNTKLVLISLLIFVLSTIGMTCWYISLHKSVVLNIENITKIVAQVGLFSAIIPSTTFTLIYFLIKNLKSKWLLSFLVIFLFVFFILVIYSITLVMVFYHLDDSKSFLKSFMEIF
mgnify:CR=1 FL=1